MTVLFAIALASLAAMQAPVRDNASATLGTGNIRGRVVAVETSSPLRRALIKLASSAPGGESITVAADEQGHYAFNSVPSGNYTLTATKSGYASLSYGQRRPAEIGRVVVVSSGKTTENVDFNLPRGAAIVVRATDETGEPVAGTSVQLLQYRYVNGERRLAGVGAVQGVPTDSLGEQRIAGLLPGDYYVAARGRIPAEAIAAAGSGRMFATTFYPGTTNIADAQRVTVGVGEEVAVSFPILAVRPVRIAGVIRRSDGSMPSQTSVFLSNMSPFGAGSRNMLAQPDGSFGLPTVLPGDYWIDVSPYSSVTAPDQEFASVPIHVSDSDQTELTIKTGKGGSVRGRFVFDTGTVPPNVRATSFRLTPAYAIRRPGAPTGRWTVNADWTFTLTGVMGAPVLRLSSTPPPPASASAQSSGAWSLKAIMLDGRDVTDTAFDFSADTAIENVQVVLTQKQSEVNGTAIDASSAPVGDYMAIVFPEDRAQWSFQSRFIAAGQSDAQGRFRCGGLPPGRYLAIAVDYLETGAERDPDLLARLRDLATPFTLGEGEARTINLRLMTY